MLNRRAWVYLIVLRGVGKRKVTDPLQLAEVTTEGQGRSDCALSSCFQPEMRTYRRTGVGPIRGRRVLKSADPAVLEST